LSSKVDIFYISTNSDLSGAPQYVRDLAIASKTAGYSVLTSFGGHGPIFKQLNSVGIRVIKIPCLRSSLNPLYDLISFGVLLATAIRFKPKIIHCHSTKAGMHGRVLGAILGIPVIFTVHGWGFGDGRKQFLSFLIKQIEKILVKHTDLYITVSNLDRAVGVNTLGIEKSRISTVHVGVKDLKSYKCRGESNTVAMIARFSYQKDHATLFRAIEGTNLKLLLIGFGTASSECKDLARLLCPRSFRNIVFIGEVDNVSPFGRTAQGK
jgi:glycosyltransferase involved in cell wall biosynthesis